MGNNNERRLAEAIFDACTESNLSKESAIELVEIALRTYGVSAFNKGAEDMHQTYVNLGTE